VRLIICLCATALLAACASQPASTGQSVAPAAPTAATAPSAEAKSAPATTAAAKPAPAAPVEEAISQSSIDQKVAEAKKEYATMEKDGQTYYCKREPKLGSRLPQYLCLTEAELINRVRTNEDAIDRARLPKPCSSGTCSGS
jgi:membrane-bound lytic murein transglycosylase B